MTLPAPLRQEVQAALERAAGGGAAIASVARLGGGCISPVARLETAGGDRFFLKWTAPGHPEGLLEAEARGLRTLTETGAVRVPRVIATPDSGRGWLLLEWIEPGHGTEDAWRRLGVDMAALHRHAGRAFGADRDNFIGPLHQANQSADSWAAFWRDRRLGPQLRLARDAGAFAGEDLARFERLLAGLEDRLGAGDDEGPSTLHGDLWSGNVHMAADGPPAVIDPSVYYGHREVDLAMADLFGGFGRGFRAAYEEAWPLAPGYAPVRRAIYQLYYLLVHVNLFGAGYVGGTRRALGEAGV